MASCMRNHQITPTLGGREVGSEFTPSTTWARSGRLPDGRTASYLPIGHRPQARTYGGRKSVSESGGSRSRRWRGREGLASRVRPLPLLASVHCRRRRPTASPRFGPRPVARPGVRELCHRWPMKDTVVLFPVVNTALTPGRHFHTNPVQDDLSMLDFPMATKQFGGPSPYKLPQTYPKEDYFHTDYVNNVTTNHAVKPPNKPVVGAIFGLGRAGSIHLISIINNPRITLKYVVDDRTERFADLKKYWNFSDKVTLLPSSEAQRVYSDKEVNVVFIGSPTWTHHDIVVNSIANNKDVFCEKPIAENIEETRKCYDAAKAKGRVLFSAFNRRFDPSYRALKNRVRNGEVGHVQILKVTARDSPLPSIDYLKTSGGVFHDCLVHDFDMACWVLGELPCRVQASATALIPEVKAIDDFDTIAFLLTFPSGTVVLGDNSRYSAYGYDQRLEVFGNKGMIKVENERPYHSTEVMIGHEGVRQSPIYYSFPSRFKQGYQNELEHFLDVVTRGVQIEVTDYQTLAVSKIATAAEESARTGKTVEIDWSKDQIPANYS